MIILHTSLNPIFLNGFKPGTAAARCNFSCFSRKGRLREAIFPPRLNCLFTVGCLVSVACRIVIIVSLLKKKTIVLIGIKILFILIKRGDTIEQLVFKNLIYFDKTSET